MFDESFGTLEREIKGKLRNDNNANVIVQGANSQTGIGKTTFAIELCRKIDISNTNWSAEQKSFIDVPDYLDAYLNQPKGSALLLDEIEAGADRRRAMSHENVQLSQGWATLRARNIATVATLPSTSMLDSRMLELADYWILVKSRGIAQPFRVFVNDFTGTVSRQPFDGGEHIRFPDLPDDDKDKKHLDRIKDDMVSGMADSVEKITLKEHKQKLQKEREKIRKEMRDEMITGVYEHTDLSTTDISDLDFVDVTQPQVSRIINSNA